MTRTIDTSKSVGASLDDRLRAWRRIAPAFGILPALAAIAAATVLFCSVATAGAILEDFSGGTLPAGLEVAGTHVDFSGGAARLNGPLSSNRIFFGSSAQNNWQTASPAAFDDFSITAASVPVPGAAWLGLVGLGVFALGRVRRRMNHTR